MFWRWRDRQLWYILTYRSTMSYSGGKHGTHTVLTVRRSSRTICRVTSRCLTSHILFSCRSSNWFPSILSSTALSSTSKHRRLHSFGRPGGRKPADDRSRSRAALSRRSSRSMILSAVTITCGSLRTELSVRFSTSQICLPRSSESFSTSAKYCFSMLRSVTL
uniref:Uncharacterized protein n=1 Tax=Ixodes ricinus TaxID=34613 RepID=A0A6B0UXY3_IXORI